MIKKGSFEGAVSRLSLLSRNWYHRKRLGDIASSWANPTKSPAAITGDRIAAVDRTPRGMAAALRALDQTSVLSAGERHLLEELLDRSPTAISAAMFAFEPFLYRGAFGSSDSEGNSSVQHGGIELPLSAETGPKL
jgi:hypothetical protein